MFHAVSSDVHVDIAMGHLYFILMLIVHSAKFLDFIVKKHPINKIIYNKTCLKHTLLF